jgi:glycosyltransferase involved in cell wall biosynthesis
MRIGFDAKRLYHNSTGLGNYSRDLLRILIKYYPSNDYILYNPKPKKHSDFNDNLGSVTVVEPTGLWKKLKSVWRCYGLSREAETVELDLFHGLSGELPKGMPSRIKTIVTIHDLIFIRYPNLYTFWDRKIHFMKFKSAAKRADKVVAISEQTKKDIIEFLNIESSKIEVIYQGCSHRFKENYSREELEDTREKFNLPQQFVLNVGTIEERKNALQIVKALKDIDITLVLVGKKTSYYQEIEDYCQQEGMSDRLMYLSGVSQKELAHIYRLATIFVYPSIFEGFGIPIIEALFSRIPVITTNSGVFPEAGGPHSIYVDPYDTASLSMELDRLLKNPELCSKIADLGFEFAQKFKDSYLAAQWEDIYEDVLRKSK